MKALVGWLSDPYVHILVVALVLVRLAMMGAADDASTASMEVVHSASCAGTHPPTESCPLPLPRSLEMAR